MLLLIHEQTSELCPSFPSVYVRTVRGFGIWQEIVAIPVKANKLKNVLADIYADGRI